MNIDQLFAENAVNFGVFQADNSLDLAHFENLAAKAQFAFFTIAGEGIASKSEFLKTFTETLKSPNVISKSWDYFEENLELLEWVGGSGTVVIYQDFQIVWRENLKEF